MRSGSARALCRTVLLPRVVKTKTALNHGVRPWLHRVESGRSSGSRQEGVENGFRRSLGEEKRRGARRGTKQGVSVSSNNPDLVSCTRHNTAFGKSVDCHGYLYGLSVRATRRGALAKAENRRRAYGFLFGRRETGLASGFRTELTGRSLGLERRQKRTAACRRDVVAVS